MSRANLILLTVECWRSDYFGESTPNIAQLGANSLVFSNTFTAGGWTLPAMTALMTSAYASMFGGCGVSLASPGRQVLAECLLHAGYWTAGLTASPICGFASGFHRGFGKFQDERRVPPPVPGLPPESDDWQKMVATGIAPHDLDTYFDAAHMTDAGLKWIADRKDDQPYFLWIHYMDPHWPCYDPERPAGHRELSEAWHDRHVYRTEVIPRRGEYDPGAEMSARWIERYRRAVAETDRQIGRLLDGVKARPDWDRTIVAVTGDHGEEFLEHGKWHHVWNSLYREGIQVPFILRVPGAVPAKVSQPVSHIDIAPTLLDYAGVSQFSYLPPMLGVSLRSLIEGVQDGHSPSRPVLCEILNHPGGASYILAIMDQNWKYIYDFDHPRQSKLFYLPDDPCEKVNLRETRPEVFRRFEISRFEHISRGLIQIMKRRRLGEPDQPMDATMKEQMIALGYMNA
jgi:arylsulfatase A-like enzyme